MLARIQSKLIMVSTHHVHQNRYRKGAALRLDII